MLAWYPTRLHTSVRFAHYLFQMPSTHKEIQKIIAAIQDTHINIGETVGHFITSDQIQGLLEQFFASQIEVEDTEDTVRARRHEVVREIKALTIKQAKAPATERSSINLQIGALLSERAKIDKLLAQIK